MKSSKTVSEGSLEGEGGNSGEAITVVGREKEVEVEERGKDVEGCQLGSRGGKLVGGACVLCRRDL